MAATRPSKDASASSRLVRRSLEVIEKEEAGGEVGSVRVNADARVGSTGECSWMVDINDSRGEGMMGVRTGGRSEEGVGTSGRVIDGTGLGDGNDSPDRLRMGERRGAWLAKR